MIVPVTIRSVNHSGMSPKKWSPNQAEFLAEKIVTLYSKLPRNEVGE